MSSEHPLEEARQLPGSKRRRRWLVWLLGVVVVLCLLCAGAAYWAYRQLEPTPAADKPVDFKVAQGESVSAIASDLQQRGIIRNALAFRVYLKYKGLGTTFQAGEYQLKPGTSVSEIVLALSSGKVVNQAVSVTIPEGFTVEKIADKLASAGICSKKSFLQEVKSGNFNESFLAQLPANAKVKYRLEGYLFPDTYEFDPGTPAHAVVQRMLDNFQKHLDKENVSAALQQRGMTLSQVVTVASLIEEEARVDKERPLVSSVIANRLQRSMKLQIDATLEYILGHKDVLTTKDTQVDDPYNTYRYSGLPPGPIGNPGMASIDAALHPAKTNYLYYVVKNDGSGEHYFAHTYQEQLHNEAVSQQNLKQHS